MKKPLTFKQASLIVIALHVIGVVVLTQYADYKAKIAKELREAKKVALLSEKRSQQDWNNSHIKPRVVATPPPKLASQSANGNNKPSNIQETLHKVTKQISSNIEQNLNEFKPKQQLVKTNPSQQYPKSTVWKVEPKQSPVKQPVVLVKKPEATKPKINISSIKRDVDKIKSEIQTIKTSSFSNGIITQTTEEIQQRMSSHIVLR